MKFMKNNRRLLAVAALVAGMSPGAHAAGFSGGYATVSSFLQGPSGYQLTSLTIFDDNSLTINDGQGHSNTFPPFKVNSQNPNELDFYFPNNPDKPGFMVLKNKDGSMTYKSSTPQLMTYQSTVFYPDNYSAYKNTVAGIWQSQDKNCKVLISQVNNFVPVLIDVVNVNSMIVLSSSNQYNFVQNLDNGTNTYQKYTSKGGPGALDPNLSMKYDNVAQTMTLKGFTALPDPEYAKCTDGLVLTKN